MRAFVLALFLLLASSAHASAGEQWYDCTGWVMVKGLGRVGYTNPACGTRANVRRNFLPWLARKILDLETRLGEKTELVGIECAPTHVACVDE